MTSLSTDNLQQELARATCNSDGLSDKENVVQEMKHHVKYLPDNLTTVAYVYIPAFCQQRWLGDRKDIRPVIILLQQCCPLEAYWGLAFPISI